MLVKEPKVAEGLVRQLLDQFRIDTRTDPHLQKTPQRVILMLTELLRGSEGIPDFNFTTFDASPEATLVVQKDIVFRSLCAHHMLPFFGVVHVGYLPDKKLAGLSKLARTVNWFAASLQIQERLTSQIRSYLDEQLQPRGTIVVAKARHLCQEMRGVRTPADTVTSAVSGVFLTEPHIKDEFLRIIGNV